MEPAQGEIALEHRAQVRAAPLGRDELVVEPQVQQRPAAVHVVLHLRRAAQRRETSGGVRARDRRDALVDGVARVAPVRRRAEDPAGGQVVGDPHERGDEVRAVEVLVLHDLLPVEVRQVPRDEIDVVLVVAVLRTGERPLMQRLVADPVGVERIDQLGERRDLLLIDEPLDDGQRVGGHG